MNKILLSIFILIILCACAGNKPAPEPVQADVSPAITQAGTVQPAAATGSAEAVAGEDAISIAAVQADASQPDNSPQSAEVAGDMEVVEVEGFKEKKHCTLVRPTGTRIAQRHCRTYKEDDRAREASRAWLERIKTRPQGYHGNSNG